MGFRSHRDSFDESFVVLTTSMNREAKIKKRRMRDNNGEGVGSASSVTMEEYIVAVNALQRQSSLAPCGRGFRRELSRTVRVRENMKCFHPPFVPPIKGGKLTVALPLLWQRLSSSRE